MAQLAFSAPEAPVLRTTETDTYVPVHRIFCVGRNYADHAREMGNDPAEPPFFFTKPAAAIVPSGASIPFPPATSELHHEAELTAVLGRGGADIAPDAALSHVWGYAAGNDLTRRDLQAKAKAARRPWDMAKGFDRSAILGDVVPAADWDGLQTGRITCLVDGTVRQDAALSEMIWPLPDIIAFLSRLVTLEAGDVIMTGTPAGVGPLAVGETCEVRIDGLPPARVTLTR